MPSQMMNPWIEIYDDEQVQWQLRQQVTNHAAVIVASLSLAVLAWSLATTRLLPYQVPVIGIAVLALIAAIWTATRILRLRSRVWCIKMSPHMLMGYDYRRSSMTVSWSEVQRVNVMQDAIAIVCQRGAAIEIPNIFPDFAHVSHRVLDLAELHRIPVHVNGRPLLETDIDELLPELSTLFHLPISGPAPG